MFYRHLEWVKSNLILKRVLKVDTGIAYLVLNIHNSFPRNFTISFVGENLKLLSADTSQDSKILQIEISSNLKQVEVGKLQYIYL